MKWLKEAEENLRRCGEDSFYSLRGFEKIDSTNEEIRREAAAGAPSGTVAVAEIQTAGRGRRGRNWESPGGEALYFSFLLRTSVAPEHISMLTLVMGLSVAQALRESGGSFSKTEKLPGAFPVMIKWPNDLVIGNKKVCGILTEAVTAGGRVDGIVIGCGINVNNEAFPEEIRERATSLFLESGVKLSRGELLARVLRSFHRNYRIFAGTESFSALRAAYDELLVNKDREVRVENPAGTYTGISRGIDESGRLIVEREGGTERISSGEVSVRGIYGYV